MPASHLTIWAPLLISGDIEASLGSSAEDGQPEEDIYEVTCFSPVAVQGLSGHFRWRQLCPTSWIPPTVIALPHSWTCWLRCPTVYWETHKEMPGKVPASNKNKCHCFELVFWTYYLLIISVLFNCQQILHLSQCIYTDTRVWKSQMLLSAAQGQDKRQWAWNGENQV